MRSAINNVGSTEENDMGLSSRSLNEGIFYFLTHKSVRIRAACVCTLDVYAIHTDNESTRQCVISEKESRGE